MPEPSAPERPKRPDPNPHCCSDAQVFRRGVARDPAQVLPAQVLLVCAILFVLLAIAGVFR